MKSIFENIFIKAVEDGELKKDILDEIEFNLAAHTRVVQATEEQIKKLEKKKQDVLDDIHCLKAQKEIIEGSL